MTFHLKLFLLPLGQFILLPLGDTFFRRLGLRWGVAFLPASWFILAWSATILLFFSAAISLPSANIRGVTMASAGFGLLLAVAAGSCYLYFAADPLPGLLGDILQGTTPASLVFGSISALCFFVPVLRRGRRRKMFT